MTTTDADERQLSEAPEESLIYRVSRLERKIEELKVDIGGF